MSSASAFSDRQSPVNNSWKWQLEAAFEHVVDVVVRSLRRKLGIEASAVETVRGTGYRYRMHASTR